MSGTADIRALDVPEFAEDAQHCVVAQGQSGANFGYVVTFE